MLDTIDVDLTGRRVLDAGCNRGGFLRLLADHSAIASGHGFDPASGAIDAACRLAGDRPLTFEVGDTVPAGWSGFRSPSATRSSTSCTTCGPTRRRCSRALEPGVPNFVVMASMPAAR